ncbi:gamma-secretase subunit APH-1A isoform X3 [Prinia subflava]|uniref:gamma-secretase subunit APH-1A isoform X3 n=1 Tax=Prinia subflava TaxID=208062 RepID=UPI002FE2A7E1
MVRVAPHAGFRGESEETGKDRSIAELSVLHLPSSKSWRHKVSTENNAWWRGCCCQQLTVSIPPCLERGKKGVFLAAVAAGGLAALVRGGAAQRAGGRGAAAARSRRGRAAAGALQVRLLQNTQEPSPLTPCWPVALPSPGCGTELMLSLWGRRKADEGLATLSEDGQSPMSLRQMAYATSWQTLPGQALSASTGTPLTTSSPLVRPGPMARRRRRRRKAPALRLRVCSHSLPHHGPDLPEPVLRGHLGPHLHPHALHRPLGLWHRWRLLPQCPQVPLL